MALSNDLISQFVKATQDEQQTNKETIAYGKIVKDGDNEYIQLDGSDLLTPISSTTVTKDGDRVMVTIKNHTAIVTGNFTNPSATNTDVVEIGNKISEFEILIGDKVTTEQLEAEIARINKLETEVAKIDELEAEIGKIGDLEADMVEIAGKITANEGEITTLRSDIAIFKDATAQNFETVNGKIHNLESDYGEFKEVTTNQIEANTGQIEILKATKLDSETADLKYATIDFSNIGEAAIEKLFTESGIIEDLVMTDGKVTGTLVGVTIIGDLIQGNTVQADKLVIKGKDGLYYRLNVDALGETTVEKDDQYQEGLTGEIILAKSITSDKIYVTDLVAFDATIGGFRITDHSLYSKVKESINNTTPGVFMSDDGQINIGDSNNYIKYYNDKIVGEDLLNLESEFTLEFYGQKEASVNIPAGTYTLSVDNYDELKIGKIFNLDDPDDPNPTEGVPYTDIGIMFGDNGIAVVTTEETLANAEDAGILFDHNNLQITLPSDETLFAVVNIGINPVTLKNLTLKNEVDNWKFSIVADDIRFKVSGKTVEQTIITATSETLAAAAQDATTKANNAQTTAISTAASDATTKANTAQTNAINTAAKDATTKANTAKSEAISAAASDATTKANNAKTEAINTAATDATNKANAAESNANDYTDGKITVVNNTITEKMAEVKITTDGISAEVSELKTTTDDFISETGETLASQQTEINKISSLETKVDGISASVSEVKSTQLATDEALNSINKDIETLSSSVSAKMSATDVQIAIQEQLENGVTSVTTSTGFTFNQNGLTVSKSGSEMSTTIDEDGMTVKQNGEERLIADNRGVVAYDLHAKTYLIMGTNSRFEDYEKDGKAQTACFWIGNTEV